MNTNNMYTSFAEESEVMEEGYNLFNLEIMGISQVEELPAPPTGACPARDIYPGLEVTIANKTPGAHWTFSDELNKLFIRMGTPIQLGFKNGRYTAEDNFYVRLLPVFEDSKHFQTAVERCYQHSNPDNLINKGMSERVSHIIWMDDPCATYDYDEESKRRSVRVPLGRPQPGADMVHKQLRFMCQNSCSGMERPIQVIFTLEDDNMVVLGRSLMKVKICRGPNRDRKNEENSLEEKSGNLKRKLPSSSTDESNKVSRPNDWLMIPVVHQDIYNELIEYALYKQRRKLEEEQRSPILRKLMSWEYMKLHSRRLRWRQLCLKCRLVRLLHSAITQEPLQLLHRRTSNISQLKK